MKRSAEGAALPSHLRNWRDVGHYRCPECAVQFKKWGGCSEHWRQEHLDEKGELTAKECRLRSLSAATNVNKEQMELIKSDIAQRIAAAPVGEARFPVSVSATAHDLALLWELVTSIDLHCQIQGDACVIRTEPFDAPEGAKEDRLFLEDELLVQELGPMEGCMAKKRKKKKKHSFLKKVSEIVTNISLERSSQRAEARSQVQKQGATDFGLNRSCEMASSAQPFGLSDRPRGSRQMDNRPAWKTMGDRPSAPALPITSGKGFDMLRRLGWTQDTGLGRKSQGIIEPIAPRSQLHKKGIGSF